MHKFWHPVPRGFLSLPMLSRCTNFGIARPAPPCTSGSANDRPCTRVITISRCFDATYHRRYIAEQRRAVGEHSAMYTKIKNVPITSATNRRHIGDARVNIGDAYSIWWYRRWFGDPSPMLADVPELLSEASAVLRRCFAERWKSLFWLVTDDQMCTIIGLTH